MSYVKAAELLDLAFEIQSHRFGMSYSSIDERSDAGTKPGKRRNTQRLVRALERLFGDRVKSTVNDLGEKVVSLQSENLKNLIDLRPDELAALDHAISAIEGINAPLEADTLRRLRSKIRLLAPKSRVARVDVDYEALLLGSHVAVRPGPRPTVDPDLMRSLTEAILAVKQIVFRYEGGATGVRTVHPYGVIFGHRLYLVGLPEGVAGTIPSQWRVDRMSDLKVLDDACIRPKGFDLEVFAKRSFGAFHNEKEYGEVEWRFRSNVRDQVMGFRFHPDQQISENDDGSVSVRFWASGLIEMAWALYAWGDNVEVIKPQALKVLITEHQRSDFPGTP